MAQSLMSRCAFGPQAKALEQLSKAKTNSSTSIARVRTPRSSFEPSCSNGVTGCGKTYFGASEARGFSPAAPTPKPQIVECVGGALLKGGAEAPPFRSAP